MSFFSWSNWLLNGQSTTYKRLGEGGDQVKTMVNQLPIKGWGRRRWSENKGPTTIAWNPNFIELLTFNLTFLPLNKGLKQFLSF